MSSLTTTSKIINYYVSTWFHLKPCSLELHNLARLFFTTTSKIFESTFVQQHLKRFSAGICKSTVWRENFQQKALPKCILSKILKSNSMGTNK